MKWTKQVEDNLVTVLSGNGSNVQDACSSVGISRETFYKHKKEDKAFADRVDSLREIVLDNVETALYKTALEGNVTACIFILKTIGKDRGYIERHEFEHSGNKKKPIVVKNDKFSNLTLAEKKAFAETLAKIGVTDDEEEDD